MAVSGPQVERTGSLRETAARLERVANLLQRAIAQVEQQQPRSQEQQP